VSEPGPPRDQGIRIACEAPNCAKQAIVFVSGKPFCSEHYIANVNALNELGLTPGNLSREGGPDPRSASPVRITEPVNAPARKPESTH
jgi:hypothetical protein